MSLYVFIIYKDEHIKMDLLLVITEQLAWPQRLGNGGRGSWQCVDFFFRG